MNWQTSKYLGGIGAILLFCSIIILGHPLLSIVPLVGLVLLLVSLYGFADFYKERGIFNFALYGFLAGVGAVVAELATVFLVVLPSTKDFLQQVFPGWDGQNWASLSGMTPSTANLNLSNFIPLVEAILAVLLVAWIFSIIVTFLYRKSLVTLAEKSGINLFSTTGLILLIGAVLLVLVIGLVLIWVCFLLLAIAFFTMKPPAETTLGQEPTQSI